MALKLLILILAQRPEIRPDQVDEVGAAIVNIVSGLDESEEQSTENFGLIANIYDDVNVLVQSGQVNISENVSKLGVYVT